ncbi:MAG: class I SAM-dependent methyltransferase [Verrucomicrobiales bacterium]|nr:class I SAM-dependent methyltransferase [Verrucomicrobiales bacterium]
MDTVRKEKLICEQTIKGDFDELKRAGFQTVTRLEEKADMGMCLLTKHKKENYGNIARAWDLLSPGGTLLCAGSNDIGVKSFEKNVRKEIPVSGNMHKNHCRVFWMKKEEVNPALCPEEWSSFNRPGKYIKDADYFTRPGIFCWEKVDKGSAFLAENLPRKVKGKVADFGSGWGYLSHHILEKYPELNELDLYEDELLALDVSRQNLEQLKLTERAKFHWYDLAGDPPRPDHYNWIISNPPFHRSARTDVSLGIKFIENAARSLKRSGSLLLVANRQLPYEKALGEYFKKTERLAESPEYKILLATVPIKR